MNPLIPATNNPSEIPELYLSIAKMGVNLFQQVPCRDRCIRGHGVNSLNYLVFPKIIALLMYPLIGISMF
jgi:hypothetical protein